MNQWKVESPETNDEHTLVGSQSIDNDINMIEIEDMNSQVHWDIEIILFIDESSISIGSKPYRLDDIIITEAARHFELFKIQMVASR